MLRGMEPTVPEAIDFSTMRELLRSAGVRYPLVTVHPELRDPEVCYVGRVVKVGRRNVSLKLINPDASWYRIRKFPMSAITRVDFDDGYAKALWQVNQAFHNTLLAHTPDVGTA